MRPTRTAAILASLVLAAGLMASCSDDAGPGSGDRSAGGNSNGTIAPDDVPIEDPTDIDWGNVDWSGDTPSFEACMATSTIVLTAGFGSMNISEPEQHEAMAREIRALASDAPPAVREDLLVLGELFSEWAEFSTSIDFDEERADEDPEYAMEIFEHIASMGEIAERRGADGAIGRLGDWVKAECDIDVFGGVPADDVD